MSRLTTSLALSAAAMALGFLAAGAHAQAPATPPLQWAPADAATSTPWAQVEGLARKEGRLVIYSGAATPATLKPVIETFEKKYGVKVELLHGRPSETRERVRAEQAAGRVQADLLMDGATLKVAAHVPHYVPHGELPNLQRMKAPFKSDGTLMPAGIGRQTVLMNTRLVKPGDEPKSWHDLLDPKWKGKILTDDPRAPGAAVVVYDVLNEKVGRPFLDKLMTQEPVVINNISVAERRVAQGEYAFLLPVRIQSIPQLRGLPVKPMRAKEGDVYIVMAFARIKGAPRPHAARLFMNHFLEADSQKALVRAAYTSVTGDIAEDLPADLREIAQSPLLGEADPNGADERRKAFHSLFAK